MTDFWFSVLFSVLVTAATLAIDWVAGRFVSLTRTVSKIRRDIDQSIADPGRLAAIREHLKDLKEKEATALAWGADLVTVALALDLSTLAIWSRSPTFFPFFQSFNGDGAQREIQVWFAIFLIHGVLLLLSLVFRHLHSDLVASQSSSVSLFSGRWWQLNRWMLGTNATGFAALLLSFVAITNAIPG
ncbi:MAG: hypothetical protein MRJ68_14810 [Nitrospira sp.]|nr:hypothetical protein [Nitrospira sp.]